MPKVVVTMGGGRTDAGNLGNGIYFGDASCTSAQVQLPSLIKPPLTVEVHYGWLKEDPVHATLPRCARQREGLYEDHEGNERSARRLPQVTSCFTIRTRSG